MRVACTARAKRGERPHVLKSEQHQSGQIDGQDEYKEVRARIEIGKVGGTWWGRGM